MSKYLKFSAAFVAFCLFTIGFYSTTQLLSVQNTIAANQPAQVVGSGASYSDINTILKGRSMYELSQAELSQVVLALQSILAKMLADLGNVSNYFGGVPPTGVPPTTGVPPVATTPVVSSAPPVECPDLPGSNAISPWYGKLYSFTFPQPYQTRFSGIGLPTTGPKVVELENVGTTEGFHIGSFVMFGAFNTDFSTLKTYMSLSKCPGDFGVEGGKYMPAGRCVMSHSGSAGDGPVFKIIAEGEESDPLFCNLIRGETYYFNQTTYDDGSGLTDGAFCQTATLGPASEGYPLILGGGSCQFYFATQAG